MSQNEFKNKCMSSGRPKNLPNRQNIAVLRSISALQHTKCLAKTV